MAVDLAEGDLARRMKRQNDGLRKVVATGLPFVTYKYAMTRGRPRGDRHRRLPLDIERGEPAAGASVARLERRGGGGRGTARADDPRLTARDVECCRQPLRVVVGERGSLPAESALVRSVAEGPVLVVGGDPRRGRGGDEAPRARGGGGRRSPAAPDGPPRAAGGRPSCLAARGVQTVLLEGGRTAGRRVVGGGAHRQGRLLRVSQGGAGHRASRGVAGRGARRSWARRSALREVEVRQCGPDVLMTGYTGEVY